MYVHVHPPTICVSWDILWDAMNSCARNKMHGHIEHGTIRADDCVDESCVCTYACKVEQWPAPCCRASSYCTDPV